jgi:flagellar biosynthesis component FlhA
MENITHVSILTIAGNTSLLQIWDKNRKDMLKYKTEETRHKLLYYLLVVITLLITMFCMIGVFRPEIVVRYSIGYSVLIFTQIIIWAVYMNYNKEISPFSFFLFLGMLSTLTFTRKYFTK